ncbi:MAG: hypothetical protein OEX97_04970 [Acidimicrobiia bacterium]|nr:hypothetical protein [Acidimicrobiia bacterium]
MDFVGRIRLTFLLLVTVLAGMALPTSTALPGDDDYRVLFSIDLEEAGLEYEGHGAEQELWGPIGIASTDDGTIWIGDGPSSRLLGYDLNGRFVAEIRLDAVVGMGDLDARGATVAILDIAAVQPSAVLVDTRTGSILTYPLPAEASLERGLSGIYLSPSLEVAAELEGGTTLVPVGSEANAVRYDANGTEVVLDAAGKAQAGAAAVGIGGDVVSLDVAGIPGSIGFVGAYGGNVYLTVDDVGQALDGEIIVDATVREISVSGKPVAQARIPMNEMVVHLPRPVTVGPSGQLLSAIPRDDRIDVVQLEKAAKATYLLTPADVSRAISIPEGYSFSYDSGMSASSSCVSRSTMGSTDWSYRSNSHYYNNTNINGSCTGRDKPSYFGSAGTYSSVSYKWGGFDSVFTFNYYMAPRTGRAGDTSRGATLSCAYGVDCSGFVSRVWQRTSKYGTSTLPNISYHIPLTWMQPYDIFNDSGSHVMLYRYSVSGGYYVSDSTTSYNYDRVVYRWISSSYASGFDTRRYNNVCVDY